MGLPTIATKASATVTSSSKMVIASVSISIVMVALLDFTVVLINFGKLNHGFLVLRVFFV